MHLDFKTYYKDTVVKMVWYWHTERHTDKWNGKAIPGEKTLQMWSMIFDKGAKAIQWEKNNLFISSEKTVCTCKKK